MSLDVFANIRATCAEVVRRARSVRIDRKELAILAAELADGDRPTPHLDPAHNRLDDTDATLAYVLTLDAINFGSGYFPFLAKRAGLSGYFTVATCLREQFDREGPWDAAGLASLGPDDAIRVFEQDPQSREATELMTLFARALTDLGAFLLEHYDGCFEGPVTEAGGRAARLVEILSTMPFYRDVAAYDELEVPFYKRAQLTAADLAVAFDGAGPGAFEDLDRLTLFADNLVPHVLRRRGVLVYQRDLADRIDAEQPIPAGRPEEVEIRAAAVHAVELLVEEIRAGGGGATARELDFVLWSRGHEADMKSHPRHRTRTTFY